MNAVAETAVKALSFGYRDRGGVMQQARASIVVGWCVALGLVVALYENPIVLAFVGVAALCTAVRCGVIREVSFVLMIAAPIGLLMALINPIATQNGITVLVAGLHFPVLGTFDVTLEAVNYGLILGLRSLVIFAICALYVSTVDPDDLLRLLRRRSVRSAITASLAVRFVPVLARDGMNMATVHRLFEDCGD
ncbi:MAG: CbiQ family ECF transporter T component, partial [Solirubrobacterales bacterium]